MNIWGWAAIAGLGLQALVLYLLGQPAICECGFISLWANDVLSPQNSQQIADWYTFSHIIHGFIFYGIAWWLFPKSSVWARLAMAVGAEVAWEVLENTPMVIDHYRQQALAQGYMGDSILNSISDTLAMMLGFFLAWRLPAWVVIVLALGMEGFAIYMVRDGLLLNAVNLLIPFKFIHEWQSGG